MQNRVLSFLQDKGINFTQKGNDVLVSCFNKRDHKRGDINPSLGVDSESGFFSCWSCKVSGNFPQFIGAMGYREDIPKYAPQFKGRALRYDIDFLKAQGQGIILPGIGRIVEKEKDWTDTNIKKYVESRKVTLSDSLKEVGNQIIHEDLDVQKRLEYIREVDSKGVSDLPIMDEFIRVTHLDYLSERGLPSPFCLNNEIYLSKTERKEIKEYKAWVSRKYFYVPIRGILGNIKAMLGISFSREQVPRMYSIGPVISSPMLDLNDVKTTQDLYVVEGWLDHYKLQVLGYNSMPTLSNNFTTTHFTIANAVAQNHNVYFIFDQDVAGYTMLKSVLKYVSRTTSNWHAVLLPHSRFKDVGDIDLLDIPTELAAAKK